MSLLRRILRVKPINHAAKGAVRMFLRGGSRARLERKLPLVDPFTVTLPNQTEIHFEPFGDACSKFLKFKGWNGYEPPSVELFYGLAQHAQVTFDVGAYLGYFGLLAAAARPGAKAYAFEAVPKLAALCKRQARLNPHLSVEVIAAAAAEREGAIALYLPKDPFISDTSTNPAHRPDRQPVEVPAVSLDGFVKERGIERVDLLKIDTETTEPAVLAGFAETIERCRPTFICEVLPTADVPALETFCKRYGYATAWIRPNGVFGRASIAPDAALQDMNFLFYPKDGTGPMAEEVRRRVVAG